MNLTEKEKVFICESLMTEIDACNDQIETAKWSAKMALNERERVNSDRNLKHYEKQKKIAVNIIKKIRDDLKTK